MRTTTKHVTNNSVFAKSQDRVVALMSRDRWLTAAEHLITRAASLAHRWSSAMKSAAQAMAAGADQYAERLRSMLTGPQLCPQPVRRQSPASANE